MWCSSKVVAQSESHKGKDRPATLTQSTIFRCLISLLQSSSFLPDLEHTGLHLVMAGMADRVCFEWEFNTGGILSTLFVFGETECVCVCRCKFLSAFGNLPKFVIRGYLPVGDPLTLHVPHMRQPNPDPHTDESGCDAEVTTCRF